MLLLMDLLMDISNFNDFNFYSSCIRIEIVVVCSAHVVLFLISILSVHMETQDSDTL